VLGWRWRLLVGAWVSRAAKRSPSWAEWENFLPSLVLFVARGHQPPGADGLMEPGKKVVTRKDVYIASERS
jgi:hypothetical protein